MVERLHDSARARARMSYRISTRILFWYDNDRPETGDKVAAALSEIIMWGILRPTRIPKRGNHDRITNQL